MLVISNNCAGAHLYNKCRIEYNNPFMWGMVFAPEMMALIRQFSSINWANIKPTWLTEQISAQFKYKYQPNIFGIQIDDVLTIYYTHYKYDPARNAPYISGPDVFYYKNYEYAFNKYMARIQRFMATNDTPSFLIVAYERYGWNDDTLTQLVSIDTSYKICVITDRTLSTKFDNISIITDKDLESKSDPVDIVSEYYTTIISALNLMK